MANFLTKMLKAYGPDRVEASGQFTTAGTGAPTTANLFGIVSVARTGVGVFLVTMQDSAKEYIVLLGQQSTAALSANRAVVSAVSLTNRTIELTVAAAGAAADSTGVTVQLLVSMRRGN